MYVDITATDIILLKYRNCNTFLHENAIMVIRMGDGGGGKSRLFMSNLINTHMHVACRCPFFMPMSLKET